MNLREQATAVRLIARWAAMLGPVVEFFGEPEELELLRQTRDFLDTTPRDVNPEAIPVPYERPTLTFLGNVADLRRGGK